ncbi:MAG: hypothetical protein JSS69_10060 [Acidobacteria bacterium]|nr:hypothetical protein [Acidobacteriota bacterium]MBS1866247.1 hypothetical protein [Acidobacteriota bacterium]
MRSIVYGSVCSPYSMNFLFSLLLSFLPPYYRQHYERESQAHILRATVATAFAELILACIFYANGFVNYIPNAAISPAAFLEYFFSWQGLMLAFFFFDGAIRLLAAVAGQAIGITPLYAIAWIHAWWHRRNLKKSECPLVPDLVERVDSGPGLRILSCRPRKNWDKWMTVMYEENLYEIVDAKLSTPPRPYVYLLGPMPESKVIRGLHRYHPDEVLDLDQD